MIEVKTEEYNNHKIAVARHDTKSKSIVIFCHGYRGSSIGPNRFFVRSANKLEAIGISSLRFDQYGSGNSDGSFFESSFNDWVATAKAIAQEYLNKGFRVALFGQSMGGSTVLAVGSDIHDLTAIVSWVPEASADDFNAPESGVIEEGGQIVQSAFWQEAHDAEIGKRLLQVKAPTYIVQCTADEYVTEPNRNLIIRNAQKNHIIDTYEGYLHSTWTYEQSEKIINKSVDFIIQSFIQQTV